MIATEAKPVSEPTSMANQASQLNAMALPFSLFEELLIGLIVFGVTNDKAA